MTAKEMHKKCMDSLNDEDIRKLNPLINPNHPKYKEFQEALNKEQERIVKQIIESRIKNQEKIIKPTSE